jgi:hypothetical protein
MRDIRYFQCCPAVIWQFYQWWTGLKAHLALIGLKKGRQRKFVKIKKVIYINSKSLYKNIRNSAYLEGPVTIKKPCGSSSIGFFRATVQNSLPLLQFDPIWVKMTRMAH